MKPKEKAKELFLRYDFWARPMMLDEADNQHRRKYYIQQLALICVEREYKAKEELLHSLERHLTFEQYSDVFKEIEDEYNEVKQEINNL